MDDLILDDRGNPVLLATVPGGGHPLVQAGKASLRPGMGKKDPNTRSGNPFHDAPTGRFGFAPGGAKVLIGGELLRLLNPTALSNLVRAARANQIAAYDSGGGKIKVVLLRDGSPVKETSIDAQHQQSGPEGATPSSIPAGVDPQEWARRQDAVRDAAREFDLMDIGDAKEFLQGRVKRPLTEDELQGFLDDVRGHRINDLIDSIDSLLRSRVESMRRGRRTVRVSPPRGWVRRTFSGLADAEIKNVLDRLVARGYSEEQLDQFVLKVRIKDEGRRSNILDVSKKGSIYGKHDTAQADSRSANRR